MKSYVALRTFAGIDPKRRVTIRLSARLCERLRGRSASLNLKITDFACAAIVRSLSQT
jgi:hypothetical protein